MKRAATLLVLMALFLGASGQAIYKEFSTRLIKFSTGYTFPLSTLLNGEITDHLINYQDNSSYVQLISASFYLTPEIGMELSYQGCYGDNLHRRYNNFFNEIDEIYGEDNYFTGKKGENIYRNNVNNNFSRGFVSIVYRIEKEPYFIIPKLGLGFTSIPSDWSEITLKEKNTNLYQRIRFDTDRISGDIFTFAPGVSAGFRIYRHILFTVDWQYSLFRSNFSYTKESTDLYTNQKQVEIIGYEKFIHSMSVGAGIVFELNYKTVPE